MKKNTKVISGRNFSLLAAAALSMTLIGGQVFPAYAENASGIEAGAVIPDNITIDRPTALANVALPSNEYGTLSWVNSSYVPEKRVQSCEVIFKPFADADLSGLPGWDSSSGTLNGYVTVVVSSIDNSSSEETVSEENTDPEETYDNGETAADSSEDSTGTSEEENPDSTEESNDQTASSDAVSDADEQDGEEADDPEITEIPSENNDDAETEIPEGEGDNTDDVIENGGEDTDTADAEVTETPEAVPSPEITETPSETDNSQDQKETDPDVTETPSATVTPSGENDSAEDVPGEEVAEDEKPEITEVPDSAEAEITEIPEDNKDNIFDREEEEEDKRPQNAATDLTETEKEATAAQNHTCDGITVSGIDLPWYVQFRVSGGEDYEFTNEEDAAIFKSYEFELWDTQKNTEYEIPDGEYISVTVPVKAGYTYSIEHLLDNGAMETIIPSVDGDTMTFSTHSFSPFGIAGSKSLVGPDTESDASTTVTPTADTSSSTNTDSTDVQDTADSTENLDSSADLTTGSVDLKDSSSEEDSNTEDEGEDQSSQTVSKKQVNTGDNTQILPFVILFVAAAVVAGVAVFFKKRKK